jgi:hypothetical protein
MTFRQKLLRTSVAAILVSAAIAVSSGVSPASASLTFVNRTTNQGLGHSGVNDVFVVGSNVYAATTGGLSISTDGGATFTNNDFGATSNSEFTYDVEVVGQNVYVATFVGLRISIDGGQTFSLVGNSDGLGANGDPFVIEVDVENGTIFASVYMNGSGFYRSTDGGDTFSAGQVWNNFTNAGGIFADGSTVYAHDSNYVYVSQDSGVSFTALASSSGFNGTAVLGGGYPQDVWASGSTIYVSTDSGLSVSADSGVTFTRYSTVEGLGSDGVYGNVFVANGQVYVGTNGGLSISAPSTPTVISIDPATGPAAGGTVITITGTNFTGASAVSVGGTACASFTVNSATEIECTTPAGSEGTASVEVTANGQASAANTLFTYEAARRRPTPPTQPPATQPPTTQPPATSAPTAPPVVTQPPGQSAAPSLITDENQETLTQTPGEATALVNGQPVPVEVEAPADLPAANVEPESRSPEQVQQLQEAANEIVNRLADAAGGAPSVAVEPTPTGAVITGLLTESVPVEDVVLVETPETATLFAALNGDGTVTEVNPGGVIEVQGDGTVGVLAYGLTPGESVELVIMSEPQLLGSFEVNEQGEVKVQAGLPDSLGAGNHTLVVASPTIKASLGLQVSARPITLPVTGGDTDTLAPVLVMLSMGAILVVVARRRITLVP